MCHTREVTSASYDLQQLDTAGQAPLPCQLKPFFYSAPVTKLFAKHEIVFTFLADPNMFSQMFQSVWTNEFRKTLFQISGLVLLLVHV